MARLQLLIPFVMLILWFLVWRWLERLHALARWRPEQRLAMALAVSGQATAWIILAIVFVALAKTRDVVAAAVVAFVCAMVVSIPSAALLANRLFPRAATLRAWTRLGRGVLLAELILLLSTTVGTLASAATYASLVDVTTRELLSDFSKPYFMLTVFGSVPAALTGAIFAAASAYLHEKS